MTATRYIDSVATGGNAGLIAYKETADQLAMAELRIVIGALTIALVLVAGLGVAHTVVLNTRERRRDVVHLRGRFPEITLTNHRG